MRARPCALADEAARRSPSASRAAAAPAGAAARRRAAAAGRRLTPRLRARRATTAPTMSSAVTPLRSASNVEDQPVAQRRQRDRADVLVGEVVAPGEQRRDAAGQGQRLRAARARPEPDVVAHDLGGAAAAAGARSRAGSRSRARGRRPAACARARPCAGASRRPRPARAAASIVGRAAHDRGQLVARRVVEVQLQQEAVELRLRQRVGALHLDRVLGREHRERPRAGVRLVADRDGPLLHRLEQRALRARRGAVDLVGQDQAARTAGPAGTRAAARGRGRSTSTTVPVMSAGIRSGVNWMRLCVIPSAPAKARTMLVLPSPGTPSSSAWPPRMRLISTPRTASRWPTIAAPTCVSIAATVVRNAAAAASRVRLVRDGGGCGIAHRDGSSKVMNLTLSSAYQRAVAAKWHTRRVPLGTRSP